jgi:dUTP pyrophosphatase
LAVKHLLDVNAGVIDSDFTGNVTVVLHNHGEAPFQITPGDRIAQMILFPNQAPTVQEVSTVTETNQGDQGFGSTGSNIIRHIDVGAGDIMPMVHPDVTNDL